MRRRDLIFLVGGAAIAPRAIRAQQKVMSVIGLLGSPSSGPAAPFVAAFRQGLSELASSRAKTSRSNTDGRRVIITGCPPWPPTSSARKVDVIAAFGSPSARAAKSATSMIPIVFASADPIGEGLVASLARPSGNLTGFSIMAPDLEPKRLELLSELVPQAELIVLLVNSNNPNTERMIRDVREAARAKGGQLAVLKAGSESEIDAAFMTSFNGKPARSSSAPIRSLAARARSLWRWRHAMPFRRSISGTNLLWPAA
jgi:putative ABC transport system substrate-binding protein